jgi:hypothetical protein
MAQANVSILFNTNAGKAAKSVKELGDAVNGIQSAVQNNARATRNQGLEAITEGFKQRSRPNPSRQSTVNAIYASNEAGLTKEMAKSARLARQQLEGFAPEVLLEKLRQGVGFAISENLKPLKDAADALRKIGQDDLAGAIDVQVEAYEVLQVRRKGAMRAFSEGKELASLEKAADAYRKMGVEIGDMTDLSDFTNKLSEISPSIAGDVRTLRASRDKLSNQDYLSQLAEISTRGVKVLADQKAVFERQLTDEVKSKSKRGDAFKNIFEQRFGSVDAQISAGTTFDMGSLADATAFSTFKDVLRKNITGYIKSQLDPKTLASFGELQQARKTTDVKRIALAVETFQKELRDRLKSVQDQIKPLEDIQLATGDNDLLNIVNMVRRQYVEGLDSLDGIMEDSVSKIQDAQFKAMKDGLQRYTDRANTFRGSKTTKTKDNIGEYMNTLDRETADLISEEVMRLRGVRFQSLGGRTFEEAGFSKNKSNILNTQVLAPAGYFTAKTQEERMDALSRAISKVGPTLQAMGLSGDELAEAEEHLTKIIRAISSQYRELLNQTQGVNAEQSEMTRQAALTYYQQTGDAAGARKMLEGYDQYVSTEVNTRRPKAGQGTAGGSASSEVDIDPQARKDRQQNLTWFDGMVADDKKRNGFMGRLRQVSAFAGSLLNVYGVVASAIGTVIDTFTQLVTKANELDRVSATVNALGGSFNLFTQAMSLATRQQALYGGTLSETMQGLTSLIPLTRKYGVDLGQLDNIARRLAVIDPLQGFSGASIALKEFFSGDITSLSRRFEIDRKSLNSIRDAGSQAEQLEALDEALSKMGISMDVLNAKTQTAAGSFDRAGASWDNFLVMLGKQTQTTLAPTADYVAELFGDSAKWVADQTEREQALISLQIQLGKTSYKIREYGKAGKEAVNEFQGFSGGIVYDAPEAIQGMQGLINEFNTLIEKLNDLRVAEGKGVIRLFSNEDAELIKKLSQLSIDLGIPMDKLLQNLDPTQQRLLTSEEVMGQQGLTGQDYAVSIARMILNPPGFGNPITDFLTKMLPKSEGDENARLIGYRDAIGYNTFGMLNQAQISVAGQLLPKMFDNTPQFGDESLGRTKNWGLNNQISANVRQVNPELLRGLQTSSKQVDLLGSESFKEQSKSFKETYGLDYQEAIKRELDVLQSSTQTTEQNIESVRKLTKLNNDFLAAREKSIRFEDKYITDNAKRFESLGSVAAKDVIVKKLDDIRQREFDTTQAILATAYGEAGGTAAPDINNTKVKEIVKFAKQNLNIDRETLYYANEIAKAQAMQALEADKTISSYRALLNLTSGIQVTLEDAVKSAINFNKQIQNVADTTIFNQLSLKSRLSITMGNFGPMTPGQPNFKPPGDTTPQNPGQTKPSIILPNPDTASFSSMLSNLQLQRPAIKNEADAVNMANQALGLLQEQANKGQSYAKQTRDINERYEKDKTDIAKKAEEERTKIMQDWSDTVVRLIEDSEYLKRAGTADFYDSLFQNDTIGVERQKEFSAQREAFRTEADAIRGEDPEKAQKIMDAGEQLIKNQMEAEEKVARFKEDNQEIDEEIADLQRDLGKAKDAEARRDIQRKIERLNAKKIENQREIDQVIAVQDLRRKADEQLLKDAREGIDSQKRARDKAIEDNKQAELTALGELDKKRKEDIQNAKTAAAEASTAQIMNETDYAYFKQIGYIAEEMARMRASGKTTGEVNDFYQSATGELKTYFAGRKSPGAEVATALLSWLETSKGSPLNGVNPAISRLTGNEANGLPPRISGGISEFIAGRLVPDQTTPDNKPSQPVDGLTALTNNSTAVYDNTVAARNLNLTMAVFNTRVWDLLNTRPALS